jgi:hypothetical protein
MFVYRIQHKDTGVGPFCQPFDNKLITNHKIKSLLLSRFDDETKILPFLKKAKHNPVNMPVFSFWDRIGKKVGVVDKHGIVDWFKGHFGSLDYCGYVVAIYQVKKQEVVSRVELAKQVAIPIHARPKYILPIEKFCKKVKVPFNKFGVLNENR